MGLILLIFACLMTFSSHGQDFPPMGGPGPHRAPGMQEEPIAFEEKEYQALYEKNKDAKEVKDYLVQIGMKKREKMDEMRKSETRPDFSKMQEERETERKEMLKGLRVVLDKLKTSIEEPKKVEVPKKVVDTKCEGGKTPTVLEKPTTDSMKDSAKVVKIVLTEDEFKRMKEDIKAEVKREMMSQMGDKRPEIKDRPERDDKPREDSGPKGEGPKKMAEGRRQQSLGGGLNFSSSGMNMMSMNMGNMNSQMQQMQMPSMNMNQGMNSQQMQMMMPPNMTRYSHHNMYGMRRPSMGMGQNRGYNFNPYQQQYQYSQNSYPQGYSQMYSGMNVNYNVYDVYGMRSAYGPYQYPMMGN